MLVESCNTMLRGSQTVMSTNDSGILVEQDRTNLHLALFFTWPRLQPEPSAAGRH